MSLKTVFSMFALSIVGALSVAACAAPTEEAIDPQEEPAASQEEELRLAKYSHCNVDNDCVATPTPACCPNGRLSAVNSGKVAAFEADNACKAPPRFCPLAMMLDTRVAQCNTTSKKCVMVKPEDIRCGGLSPNPHHCPTDYSCTGAGLPVDAPGKCTKDVSDCRSTGCGAGKYCSACWGSFACIPNGALC